MNDVIVLIIVLIPFSCIYLFLKIFFKNLNDYKELCHENLTYLEKELDMKINSIEDIPQRIIKREKTNKLTNIIISLILFIITSVIVLAIILFIYNSAQSTIDKPIIYLYPEEETKITVELENDQLITTSYPKYQEQWEVIASPNGDLIDCKTGRKLYALYYESDSNIERKIDEGFIVKGEEACSFLEEKLAILGLNERETEEFIIYWLPKLENNKYNLIHFETIEEITEDMPLTITPKPDTLIRIIMLIKEINQPFDIQEQVLETPTRNGFTVVEWGGRILD